MSGPWRFGAFLLPVAGVLALGCAPRERTVETRLSLRLSDAFDCRPSEPVSRIDVRALGDFPTSDGTVAELTPSDLPWVIDRFPVDTAEMTIEAQAGQAWQGAGSRLVPSGNLDGPILLLPFGRSCPVGDPELAVPDGAAVTALPDGGLLIVGGERASVAVRRMLRLSPGEQQVHDVGTGLEVTRTAATATVTGGLVVIAGGAQGTAGVAHDTYEVYDLQDDSVRFGTARLAVPRRDQGATRLPDGRVLLVGGRSEASGPVLGSAEILDAVEDTVHEVAGQLAVPRVDPQVLTLDDGTVVVVGGVDDSGAFVGSMEKFDPASDGFVSVGCALAGPGVGVALPGARVGWVFDDPSADVVRTMVLRRNAAGGFDCIDVTSAAPPPALAGLTATALPDGRLLVEGDRSGAPAAYLIDPGLADAQVTDASRPPAALVSLGDGAVAELGPQGGSLHRELLISPFDNPPATLLAGSTDGVSFDAAGRWQQQGALFVSRAADARLDVPTLRFADVQVELDATAQVPAQLAAELLLTIDGRSPVAVTMGPDAVGLPGCMASRAPGAPLQVVRKGSRLEVSAGAETAVCAFPDPNVRIGLAVRAQPGTALRALRITRL